MFDKADIQQGSFIPILNPVSSVTPIVAKPVTVKTTFPGGIGYAPGTYDPKDPYSAKFINPPLTNLPGNRDPNIYTDVLNQFGVETNPRYDQRNNNTYCNIFVWDATRAMGAEIPHWVVPKSGAPVEVGKGIELNANGVVNWLNKSGSQNGWHAETAVEAQQLANDGHPAVAVWNNPGGIGHVAMVRPGEYSTTNGPCIAQAGGVNTSSGTVGQNFVVASKKDQMQYFVHD